MCWYQKMRKVLKATGYFVMSECGKLATDRTWKLQFMFSIFFLKKRILYKNGDVPFNKLSIYLYPYILLSW